MLRRLLLDRRRGALWWSTGTSSGVATIVALWSSVKNSADLEDVIKNLPKGVRALFGTQADISISSAPGYLQARLFATILPVLLLVYAIGLGARIVGGAEEDGTLQLVVASPVTRRRIAIERFGGAKVLVLLQVVVGLVTGIAVGAAVGVFDDVSMGRFVVATVAVAELALLHLAIAFAVGAATGRRGPARSAASAVAVGGYVVYGIASSAAALRSLRVVSPWWWYLDRNMLVQDPTFLSLGLPLVLATAIVVAGIAAYERRDLRLP
ncbi:MAG: beta-exotoxin transport system permease protein [Actinomycetota bacterium]